MNVKLSPGFPSVLCARSAGQEPPSLSYSSRLLLLKLHFWSGQSSDQVWKVPSLKAKDSR